MEDSWWSPKRANHNAAPHHGLKRPPGKETTSQELPDDRVARMGCWLRSAAPEVFELGSVRHHVRRQRETGVGGAWVGAGKLPQGLGLVPVRGTGVCRFCEKSANIVCEVCGDSTLLVWDAKDLGEQLFAKLVSPVREAI